MTRTLSHSRACTNARARLKASRDDDVENDDDELGMPLPEWDDPDWGFDNEEAEPEDGDFWFDNDDEENAL
jgi:hypothetical protein